MKQRKSPFDRIGLVFFSMVLIGIAIGFGLATFYFTGSPTLSKGEPAFAQDRTGAQAQTPSGSDSQPVPGAEPLSFREVSRRVLPMVVQLNIVELREQQTPEGNLPWFYYFFQQPPGQDEAPQQRESPVRGLGSGVIVRRDGKTYYVLTNQHVAGSANEIDITFYNESKLTGKLVGSDPRRDLALVSFESDEDLPVATLGDSDDLAVGDWVLAIGNPFGFTSTVTAGIVSALGRRGGPDGNISDFIQTDAAINQGNSGGALVNLRGEVVGINTWIAAPGGGNIGLGFAIPINNAKRAIGDFITTGEVEYGWLGVSISDVPRVVSEQYTMRQAQGAFVHHVFQDSPADKGGLKPGDVVIEMNGVRITSSDQLTRLIGDLRAGEKAGFRVNRQGDVVNTNVEITRRESQQTITQMQRRLWPGLTVVPLTEEIRTQFNITAEVQGVVSADVESRTPADIAGLRPGDVILSINDSKTASIADFYKQLNRAQGGEIRFRFLRDGVELTVGVVNGGRRG